MTQREERERILARLLAGDLDPDAPEARAFLAADPDARAELDGLHALAGELDELFVEERATLAEADGERNVPGLDRVAPVLQDLAGRAAPRPHGVLLRLALGLAALALISIGLWRVVRAPDAPPTTLGGGLLEILAPEAGAPLDVVRWKGDLSPGGWYGIRVVDATEAGAGRVLVPDERTNEKAWTPPPESESWPARVRFEVSAYDVDGDELGRATVVLSVPR